MHHHHNETLSRRRLAKGLLSVLLAAALPGYAGALPLDISGDESEEEEALFIGNLNADQAADTIYGRLTADANYRPTHIAWGMSTAAQHSASETPGRTTEFIYPDWHRRGVSLSVNNMNADSLADLVFYIWGSFPEHARSVSLVVCGAPGADTVAAIDLGSMAAAGALQAGTYLISAGVHLVDPAIRDQTGIESYVRLPLTLDPPEPRHPAPAETTASLPQVRLHPNPADDNVEVNASGLTPGICTITTVDLEGRQIRSEPGKIGSDGRLMTSLDLEGLPSGYYIVRIDDGQHVVASLPLLVVH